MNIIILTLVGGSVGVLIRFYLSYFVSDIIQSVYINYYEVFPDAEPEDIDSLDEIFEKNRIQPLKSGQNIQSFLYGVIFFNLCGLCFTNLWLALWVACYFSLLLPICILDWNHKLIPVNLCQLLISLGIAGAYWHISPIEISQVMESSALGFAFFWLVYQMAIYYYQRETFGRGDYWLIAGLACFFPWQHLPIMSFIACILAISYVLFTKWRKQEMEFIPFAPFLALAGALLFMLNLADKILN